MLTATSYRRRKIIRSFSDEVEAVDRIVDIGVTLKVVRADDSGEVLIPGSRPMVVLREYHFGGMLDTRSDPPRILGGEDGISASPQVWFCSQDQERVILHPDAATDGQLVIGGMGAGKTTAGVIWTYLRWLEHIGTREEGGITAPTERRLALVLDEFFRMFPAHWYSFSSSTGMMTLVDGTRLRAVSTYQQSEAGGSRIQGFNWSWWLGDELQDQLSQFIHIQARLRSSKRGKAKRLGTATAKDDPAWRDIKTDLVQSGIWTTHTLLGPNSPFIHPNHWDAMKRMTTDREYRRVVLAEDLPSESRLYHCWNRSVNLCPIPLGAKKITSIVLSRKTGDRADSLLIGHDPGAAKTGTVWLDAYEIRQRPGEVLWWVRAELLTLHETMERHVTQALQITRDKFGANLRPGEDRAHVRSQPWGHAEDRPDLSVFKVWERFGFRIKAAQYSKNGTAMAHIKKESRFEVLNTLFCSASGRSRLFVECDDRKVPAAPKLVTALESMERDARGRPEMERKDIRYDQSDLPAALWRAAANGNRW